ncbi:VIPAS39 [Mytilus coruscus]|uniref:VIPAS39 n=1 Tax=Mytilus coruscus TaxID=42192 RepID=A0A6J8EG04_MYTCO|nr:VIPAS39 [Mytilus coruscus]
MSSLRKSSVEDEYWDTSRASAKKNKGFNLFDDTVSVETADELRKSKRLLRSFDEDDDDATDTINWDGTPSVDTASRTPQPTTVSPSPMHQPIKSSLSHDKSRERLHPIQQMTHTRSQSFTIEAQDQSTKIESAGNVSFQPDSGSMLYSKSHEKLSTSSSNTSLNNQSIHDVVTSYQLKTPQTNDPKKLVEQIQFLQRALDRAKASGGSKIPVDDTVQRIINGEQYSLEMYKSKDDKFALLDRAIKLHDGNAITAIILFIKKTIKPSIFNLELQRRPVAANHLISYMKAHYDLKELEDLLGMLGRNEEAAMLKYKQAVSISDAGAKLKSLDMCLRAHFSANPQLSGETPLLQEHIALLERQRPIEDSDKKAELSGTVMMFKQYPRKASILNMSAVTTLYYCCFYHSTEGENHLACPEAIRKQHQLTDKQFVWTALSARARLKQWNGVDELLTTKGWFGGTKARAVIGFDRVCQILNQCNAPLEVLTKYLKLIDNTEKRLDLARKFKCHNVVIETLVSMKDRAQLDFYAKKLQPGTVEARSAAGALNNSSIKWKN